MRITLHDMILADAGEARPESRPTPGDDVRAPWVRRMHGRLPAVDARGGSFAAGFRVGVWVLQIHAVRHGTAVAGVWSVAADGEPAAQVVAASVLLSGEDGADDEAVLGVLRDHPARLPVPEADYAEIARQPRPCLATLYLDADWYNNGSIELLATALSLATLFGPEGRLAVAAPAQSQPRPAPAPPPASPHGPPTLSPERMGLIMEMVKKKANLAFEGVSGVHFRVFAPRAFADRRGGGGRGLFARLKDTAWWVRWNDDRLDRLAFAEFLAFVDQVLEIEKAFYAAVAGEAPKSPRAKANDSTWVRSEPAGPRPAPLRVRHRFDSNKLVGDDAIRRLLDVVTIEPTLPDHTRGASAGGGLFRSE